MKAFRFLLAASMLASGMATATAATTNWTMATGYPDNSFLTENIRLFIKDIEEKSEGRLKIDLRSNGTLIKHDAIKRAVQSGQVPLGEIRMGVYGNESAMYILDSLPNIAKNYDEAALLTQAQKPFFDALFQKNRMRVLTYVAWPGQGFYTKNPVTSPDDFKGQKLRIYSQATQRMGELLGFRATILPFAEVPQAFATGLIEALFTSAQTGTDIQIWDNAKYFTYTGTMHNKNAIIVNERAFKALDDDLQKIVLEAGERATHRGWELSKKANEDKIDVLKENGIVVTEASPELDAEMEKVGTVMIEEWREAATAEEQKVLDEYLKLRQEASNKVSS